MADMKLQDLMLAILGLVLFWFSSSFLTPLPFLAYKYGFELFLRKDSGLDILNNVGTLKNTGSWKWTVLACVFVTVIKHCDQKQLRAERFTWLTNWSVIKRSQGRNSRQEL